MTKNLLKMTQKNLEKSIDEWYDRLTTKEYLF